MPAKTALGAVQVDVPDAHLVQQSGITQLTIAATRYAQELVDSICKGRNEITGQDVENTVTLMSLERPSSRSAASLGQIALRTGSTLAAIGAGVFGSFLASSDKFVVGVVGTLLMAILVIVLSLWDFTMRAKND